MRLIPLIAAIFLAHSPAHADAWSAMTGDQINATLGGARVNYQGGWQIFHPNGRTQYVVGGESWGNWRIDGDRYCSQWPPSDHWDCYDMTIHADSGAVRFISSTGRVFEGTLAD